MNYKSPVVNPPPRPTYMYAARITRVIDGDTVEAMVDAGFHMTLSLKLRLAGINAPEMHDADAGVRDRATKALIRLSSLVMNQNVVIETQKPDAFGRYLATLFTLDGLNVNIILINEGHAVPFK